MNAEDRDKKVYELALLTRGEGDVAAVLTLLKQHNGELTSEPRAKKLALAYEIKGETEAVFTSVTFRAAGEDVKNLEHDMNNKAEVLRSLILVAPRTTDRPPSQPYMPTFPGKKRSTRPATSSRPSSDAKPAAPQTLSNEALEKKIEEILQ